MLTKSITFGGDGPGADPDVFALLYKNVFDAKIKLVSGYHGTTPIILAMERGEVDGLCGYSWSTIKSKNQSWLDEKKINILIQAALKKEPDLPDVPLALDLAKTDEQRQILKLFLTSQETARPFAAPPGIPADRKAALISAFDADHEGSGIPGRGQEAQPRRQPAESPDLPSTDGRALRDAEADPGKSRAGDRKVMARILPVQVATLTTSRN